MITQWKGFRFNSQYLISNDGQVKSSVRGERILKGLIKPDGYKMYYLQLTAGKSKWFYAHRLTAEHFIDNPHGKPEVNHKDGINHPKFTGYYVSPDGTKYHSANHAQQQTGTHYKSVLRWSKQNLNGWSFQLK